MTPLRFCLLCGAMVIALGMWVLSRFPIDDAQAVHQHSVAIHWVGKAPASCQIWKASTDAERREIVDGNSAIDAEDWRPSAPLRLHSYGPTLWKWQAIPLQKWVILKGPCDAGKEAWVKEVPLHMDLLNQGSVELESPCSGETQKRLP